MSCGMSQGVVWCQLDVFWLGLFSAFLGVFILAYTAGVHLHGQMWSLDRRWEHYRRAMSRPEQEQDESPGTRGPTTETAAQKLSGDSLNQSMPYPYDAETDGGRSDHGWDPTERERVRWGEGDGPK